MLIAIRGIVAAGTLKRAEGEAVKLVLLISAATVAVGAGNLLLSAGARVSGAQQDPVASWSLAFYLRPRLILGFLLYIISFLLYLQVLARADITRVYPIMVGGAFIIVFAGARLWLGERVTSWGVLGAILIGCGVTLCSRW